MKIETTKEYCSYFRRADEYEIECEVITGEGDNLGTKKIQLSFTKWSVESDNETDSGCDFDEDSQKIYDGLDEDAQINIDGYINEITHK